MRNGNEKWEMEMRMTMRMRMSMTMRNEKWEMEISNFAHWSYELTEKDFFDKLYKNELLLV